jgi:hypothetical protein
VIVPVLNQPKGSGVITCAVSIFRFPGFSFLLSFSGDTNQSGSAFVHAGFGHSFMLFWV